jgi:cytosine/adenosine deaminase-related metal-dependent hydrolase
MRGIEASWLWAGRADEAPLARGAVVVDAEGKVAAVGPAATLRARWTGAAWERHEGVLLPGLVNARVCLELSGLRGRVPGGGGFVPWFAALTEARERLAPERDLESIEAALSELLRFGTAAIGEVSRTLASLELLGTAPLLARVHQELAGLRRETAAVVRAMAEAERARARVPANVELALAPHSLFALHPLVLAPLFDASAPVPMPLAWAAAERAFLADGGGPLGGWLRAEGADPTGEPPPGLDAIAHAGALGVLGPRLVATHLSDARPAELAALVESGARCVLCPRASLHVELKLPPLLDLERLGARPGLGSDSLACASSLDVLEDALALHRRFPTVAPARLLAMATSFGAEALGLQRWVGALELGRAPGVLLFEAPPQQALDPLAHVLTQAGRARRVLVRPGSRFA